MPTGPTRSALDRARAEHQGRRWEPARAGFRAAADRGEDLSADDLAAWADAAWWLGLAEETERVGERAHARFVAENRPRDASSAAIGVATSLFLRGDQTAGAGWLARAQRLLADLPESADHAYLRYLIEVDGGLDGPDLAAVATSARGVREAGDRYGDRTLVAIGILGEGRALVRSGQITAGLTALDEAMVAVLADDLAPEWAGNIYCHLIAACYELADLRRARDWLAAAERWLATLPPAVVFTGICRVHRSQFLAIQGDWARAEQEANRVCQEVAGVHVASVAEAHYTLGDLHRQRGDLAAAASAYQRAHELGRDPQPGQALLLLAQGRTGAAAASIRAALAAHVHNRLTRARLCAAQVQIGVATGDLVTARAATVELDATANDYATPGLRAAAEHARGCLLLAEDGPAAALSVLRSAGQRWHELDAPYDAAQVRLVLARAYRGLGDDEAAARELAAAKATFDRLGIGVAALTGEREDRLTDREIEVLVLVAAGATNRRVATSLSISEKTVARHLSNIFAKIGVSSRTEAASYAFRAGIATPAHG